MKTQLLIIGTVPAILLATSLFAQPSQMPPPPPAEEVVIDMFTHYDVDESGTLNQDELAAAFVGTRAKHMVQRYEAGLCPNPQQCRSGTGKGQGRGMGMGQGRAMGNRPGPRAPQEFTPGLIERFDVDGDSELTTEEALNAITFLHENRGPGRPGPPQAKNQSASDSVE